MSRQKNYKNYSVESKTSASEHWLNKLILGLLLGSALSSIVLLGGARSWVAFPALSIIYFALALYFLRSLFFSSIRQICLPPAFWLLLLFLGYSLYQLLDNSFLTYATRNEFLQVTAYLFTLVALCDLLRQKKAPNQIYGILFFFVSLIAWYALIQHAQDSNMVLNLGDLKYERPKGYGMRASGTYICPNHFAALLSMIIVMSLAVIFASGMGFVARLFAGYALIVMFPALLLTGSRSGWIGVTLGTILTGILLFYKKSKILCFIFIIFIPIALTTVSYGLWNYSPLFKNRVERVLKKDIKTTITQGDIRCILWKDTGAMIKAKPFRGYGPGTFREIFPSFRENFKSGKHYLRYAHNEYLHTWAEYGLVGLLILFLALLWTIVRLFVTYAKSDNAFDIALVSGLLGVILTATSHAFFDFQFHIFSICLVAVFLGGVVFAQMHEKKFLKSIPLSSGFVRLLSIFLAFCMFSFSALSLQVYFGYRAREKAKTLKKELNPLGAKKQLETASKIDPWHPEPFRELAHDYKAKAFWKRIPRNVGDKEKQKAIEKKQQLEKKALEYYDKSLKRNPLDTESLYGKSKLLAQLGQTEKALAMMEQITRQDPYGLFYKIQYGLMLKKEKQYKKALQAFKAASRIDSRNETVKINIQQLRKKLKDKS